MRLAFFIAKENLAIKKFHSLLELTHFNEDGKVPELTHYSEKSFREMIEIFSSILQKETLHKARDSEYFSILVDESMDSSKHENLLIHIRYFNTNESKTQTEYVTTRRLTRCDAQGLYDTVQKFFSENNLKFRKLMGFGSDGASVIIGVRQSLLQKLKQKNPFVTNTHCINHRLALASSDLLEQIPYLVEYVEIISDIHNFFSKSAKRNLTLKENQIIHMIRHCPTRWLSLYNCVDHVLRCLQSIVITLHEEVNNKN
jgi:hypothetical protein